MAATSCMTKDQEHRVEYRDRGDRECLRSDEA